jgi:hypothetical protein
MLKAGTKTTAIAKKLKRTVGAIYARAKSKALNEEKACGGISVCR